MKYEFFHWNTYAHVPASLCPLAVMVVLVSPAITHMPPFSQEGTQTAKIEYNLNRKDKTLLDFPEKLFMKHAI